MDNLSGTSRRKKRRTRKCLDEIRNRSRSRRGIFFSKACTNGQNAKNDSKNKTVITLNRLTLAMFPKAIRSETITRPILAEIKLKPKLNDSVNDLKVFTAVTSSSIRKPEIISTNERDAHSNYALPSMKHTIMNNQKSTSETTAYKEKEKTSETYRYLEDESSGSLFSPMGQVVEADKLSNSDLTATTMTTPSHSSHEDYGYHIYEELMAEIPVYLKNNTSPLIKEDVIKKTRALLERLYIESCHRECEDNIIKCMKNSVSSNTTPFSHLEAIDQNPMDYIRLEYERRQGTVHGYNVSVSDNSSSPLDPHSPLGPLELLPSVPPPVTGAHDTPEYSYYPHKLNH